MSWTIASSSAPGSASRMSVFGAGTIAPLCSTIHRRAGEDEIPIDLPWRRFWLSPRGHPRGHSSGRWGCGRLGLGSTYQRLPNEQRPGVDEQPYEEPPCCPARDGVVTGHVEGALLAPPPCHTPTL